jgi:excisionase family DNA binding protein
MIVATKPAPRAAELSAGTQDQLGEIIRLLGEVRGGLEFIREMLQGHRKPYYTVEELARLSARSAYTVRRWISAKKIHAIRIAGTGPNGRLLIPHEELSKLISGGMGSNVTEATLA